MFTNKKNQLNEFFAVDGNPNKTSEQTNPNLPGAGDSIEGDAGINSSSTTIVNDRSEREKIINTITESKRKVLDDIKDSLSREYHLGTNGLIDNNIALNNTHRLKTVQNREVTSNNLKLNKLQNDILTVRRLIEHNENNYQLKQDQLYILKNIFFCLLIFVILITLSNIIDGYAPPALKNVGGLGITKLIAICVVCLFAVKIVFYYYTHRLRNNVISRKYDWPDPTDLKESEKIVDSAKYKIRALVCTPGSHPSKQNPTKCVQNKCRCDNGVAKKGKECEWDTVNNTKLYAQDCKRCNTGYTLVDRKCLLNKSNKCKNE